MCDNPVVDMFTIGLFTSHRYALLVLPLAIARGPGPDIDLILTLHQWRLRILHIVLLFLPLHAIS